MDSLNHFTCIAYDTVDFLIQSKSVLFGVFLDVEKNEKNIVFNRETLPHIHIGELLEKQFNCARTGDCNVVLVMRIQDFIKEVRKDIINYTNTAFPASGNFALSVNTSISSKIIDTSNLRLLPLGIRDQQAKCGVSAIGFSLGGKNGTILRKQILISPDYLLKKFFSTGLIKSSE
ncbi:MAG: hypothetical protein IJ158_10310 [Treponema sp.]|nr:hypothetical protein [Treponema sp.]MBR1404683.1 hypothetical protein [Treponema sp.]